MSARGRRGETGVRGAMEPNGGWGSGNCAQEIGLQAWCGSGARPARRTSSR